MFCVTWFVVASSITEPIAEKANHCSCAPHAGAACGPASPIAAAGNASFERQAIDAHNATSTT